LVGKLQKGFDSYSEGKDQEECSSKPAGANSSPDFIWKIPNTKKGWWRGWHLSSKSEALSSSPSTTKKKKKEKALIGLRGTGKNGCVVEAKMSHEGRKKGLRCRPKLRLNL
jgi:hypothetical protein